jgi:gamma-glutamyltranspeptidase/glutathione hydrolase
VLQPAIELAEGGFPVAPITAHHWQQLLWQITNQGGPGVASFTTAEGKAPVAGQIMKNEDLAATFRRLAEHGAAKGGCCS